MLKLTLAITNGEVTEEFTIHRKSITEYKDKVKYQSSYTYNGEDKCPKVSISGLKLYDDYEVKYSNNTDPGKHAKITITGKGNYKNSIVKYFTIEKYNINKIKFDFGPSKFKYTGKRICPQLARVYFEKNFNGHGFQLNKGYMIEYCNNINVGTAKIEIYGIGDYFTGHVTKKFKIVK